MRLPARMAGEYAPMALGASGDETTVLWMATTTASGGLGDLARAQAPRADADPAGRAVDQGLHRLQIGLEPARTDVVGVGNRPADHRTFVADFAALGHDSSIRGDL